MESPSIEITAPGDPRVRRLDPMGWSVCIERLVDDSRGYMTIAMGTVREWAFVRQMWLGQGRPDERYLYRALWLPEGSLARVPRHKSWSGWADADAIPTDLSLAVLCPFERGELIFGGWSMFDFTYEVPRGAALSPRFFQLLTSLHERDR